MFQFGGLELCLGELSPPKAPRGDGSEQTVDKSRMSCRSYYFSCSFYESVQLMLLLYLSEGIKITLQRT